MNIRECGWVGLVHVLSVRAVRHAVTRMAMDRTASAMLRVAYGTARRLPSTCSCRVVRDEGLDLNAITHSHTHTHTQRVAHVCSL